MINYSDFITALAAEVPLRLRWEKGTRYYEVYVEQDLWGDWVLTRIWGRRNSPAGQIRRIPCESYEEAGRKLATVRNQRIRHGYESVTPR
jgi:predicted DNA-binding WGR domain protein